MTYKPFILLLGIFLGSHRPAVAQTPTPQIVLAQQHIVPALSVLPTVSAALPAFSFLLFQNPEKFNPHFSRQFAGAYPRDYRLEHLSPLNEVRTVILSQSSLPLVQFWGGRLQLDAFQSTLRIQNGQLGLVGGGGMRNSLLSGQTFPGGPRSVHLAGLSLSFRFGRDARTGHPAQLWRRVTHMVDAVLN
ncbi:MAG: hypothetical protein JWO71_579 [Candidatus Acidoferrum typicum]|nr:hypothetical protein [Candidatus Acidoferrum typicum]